MTSPTLNQVALLELQNGLDTAGNGQAYSELMSYINSSPALINQINNDVNYVTSFNWSTQSGSGAFFNPSNNSINININQLLSEYQGNDTYSEVFVLGHELGHSEFDNNPSNPAGLTEVQALQYFQNDINSQISAGNLDFTSAISSIQANFNYNESYAQIQGFNDDLSEYYAEKNITSPTVDDVKDAYSALQKNFYDDFFLENGSLRSGFTANADGSLSETLSNMGAEGDYYYLNTLSTLGIFGDKDYTNSNGTNEVGDIVDAFMNDPSDYTASGSQITITQTVQINFENISTSNDGSGSFDRSFDPNLLAQDLGSYLTLPEGCTSVSFTVQDASTGTDYVYTVNDGVSSVSTTASGATPMVYVGESANSAGTSYQLSASNSVVTIAAGYVGDVDGSDDTDILQNNSSVATQSDSANNTITCGSSSAIINGESDESCSINSSGNGVLTVDGSDLTGSLQGSVVLTESGDAFTADSNSNIAMASGDIVAVGSTTSNVQLTCGSVTETVTGGESGSDSVECEITNGSGDFENNGNDLEIGLNGTASLAGGDDTISLTSGSNLSLTSNGGPNIVNAGSGDAVFVEKNDAEGDFDTINANNDEGITLGSGSSLNVNGEGNTITAEGNNYLLSGGNTIDVGDQTVSLSDTGQVQNTVVGSGFTLDQNHGAVAFDGDGTLTGNNNTLQVDSGFNATVTGYNTINLDSGSSVDATYEYGGDTINAGANGSVEISDDGGGYYDTVNATDAAGSITVDNGSSLSVDGEGNTITAEGNNYLLSGGNTIDVGDQTVSLSDTGQVQNTVVGSGFTLQQNYGAVAFDGDGTLTGNNNTLEVDSGFNATVTGYNTINLDSGSSVDVTNNDGGDTINAGANGSVQISDGGGGYYDTVNATDAAGSITVDNGSSLSVDGEGNTITAEGNNYLLSGGNTIDVGDQTVSLSDTGQVQNTVVGSGFTLQQNYGAVAFDGDGTLTGNNNTLEVDSGFNATVTGYNTINLDSGSSVDVTNNDGGDTINAGANGSVEISDDGGGYYDTVNATDDSGTITLNQGAGADIVGSGDTIAGEGDNDVAVDGQNDVITASNATIDVTSNNNIVIDGSGDTIVGGSDDSFIITGNDNDVSATSSSIAFDGSNTGDDVTGADDTGSNWAAPDPDDTGYSGGYGGYSDDGGDDGSGYGLTAWRGKKPTAEEIAKAEQSDSLYEGAKWADKTITWGFAGMSAGFSDAITGDREQLAIEKAFQSWAKASGLNLEQVANGTSADIEVGFSDLDTASTNQIGLTTYHDTDGVLSSVDVELEDPNQVGLISNGQGQLAYASTGATFEQVALHEIGHALGLADTDIAGSIMNAVLGQGNRTLSTADIADVQALYKDQPTISSTADMMASLRTQQLVQAMNAFEPEGQGTDNLQSILSNERMQHELPLTTALASRIA